MKNIEMTKHLLKNNRWETSPKKVTFQRISGWIAVKHDYAPQKNDSLWSYVTDGDGFYPHEDKFDPEHGLFLDYFVFGGRRYAMNQFLRLGSIWAAVAFSYEDEDGKPSFLSGFDIEDYFNPIHVEFDEDYEKVRLYREVL